MVVETLRLTAKGNDEEEEEECEVLCCLINSFKLTV
jgi:hypothetical protein